MTAFVYKTSGGSVLKAGPAAGSAVDSNTK